MFVVIFNKSIIDVRGDVNKKGDMFGIVDMLIKFFKDLVGIVYKLEVFVLKRVEVKKSKLYGIFFFCKNYI